MPNHSCIRVIASFVPLFSLFADAVPRPIEIKDILSWKRIQSATVSPDGGWFAYRLIPNEGDSELVLLNLKDAKELRYPIGEAAPATAGAIGAPLALGLSFSDDGRYCAFETAPTRAQARKGRKDKKTLYNKVTLVELNSAKVTSFDKVKSFAFSGELPGWLALHKYTGEAQDKEPPATRFSGSDLLLYELATGDHLNLGNVAEYAFNKPGTHLAIAIDAAEKSGNGIQLRDMRSGTLSHLDSAKANYKSLSWTEKGDGLAALKGTDDKSYQDKL